MANNNQELKKYNFLTPIEYVGKTRFHKSIWKFKCDCGGEKECILSDVKYGRTKSCGCLQYFNGVMNGFLRVITIEGEAYEGFKVIEKNLNKPSKRFGKVQHARYICECNCGKIFEANGRSILSGFTKRCPKCQSIYNGKNATINLIPFEITCIICQEKIMTRMKRQKFCSMKCNRKNQRLVRKLRGK